MQIKELIAQLKRFPSTTEVHFETNEGDLIDEMVCEQGFEGVIIKEL